jgi:hypothetical protein
MTRLLERFKLREIQSSPLPNVAGGPAARAGAKAESAKSRSRRPNVGRAAPVQGVAVVRQSARSTHSR